MLLIVLRISPRHAALDPCVRPRAHRGKVEEVTAREAVNRGAAVVALPDSQNKPRPGFVFHTE